MKIKKKNSAKSGTSGIKISRETWQALCKTKLLEIMDDKDNPINVLLAAIEKTKKEVERVTKETYAYQKQIEELVEQQENFLRESDDLPEVTYRSVGVGVDMSSDDDVNGIAGIKANLSDLNATGTVIGVPNPSFRHIKTEPDFAQIVSLPAGNKKALLKRSSVDSVDLIVKGDKPQPKQFKLLPRTTKPSSKLHGALTPGAVVNRPLLMQRDGINVPSRFTAVSFVTLPFQLPYQVRLQANSVSGNSTLNVPFIYVPQGVPAGSVQFQRAPQGVPAGSVQLQRAPQGVPAGSVQLQRAPQGVPAGSVQFQRAPQGVPAGSVQFQLAPQGMPAASVQFQRAPQGMAAASVQFQQAPRAMPAASVQFQRTPRAMTPGSAQKQHASQVVAAASAQYQQAPRAVTPGSAQKQRASRVVAAASVQYQRAPKVAAAASAQYQRATKVVAAASAQYQRATKVVAAASAQYQSATKIVAATSVQSQRIYYAPVNLIPHQVGAQDNRAILPQKTVSVRLPFTGSAVPSIAKGIVLPKNAILMSSSSGQILAGQSNIKTLSSAPKTTIIKAKHPAPLPEQPKYPLQNTTTLLEVPPKPFLKVSQRDSGIILSWGLPITGTYAQIKTYQLYGYEETVCPPDTSMWKKIGEIRALPLPMACTLAQYTEGCHYHFAIRAVDVHYRNGPFSDPVDIIIRPDSESSS